LFGKSVFDPRAMWFAEFQYFDQIMRPGNVLVMVRQYCFECFFCGLLAKEADDFDVHWAVGFRCKAESRSASAYSIHSLECAMLSIQQHPLVGNGVLDC